ncbi:MAG TPA: DUF3108 domain-containing protein [Longimicrobiaceae bacterium]
MRRLTPARRARAVVVPAACALLLAAGAAADARPAPSGVPFQVGEELTFRVRSSRFGTLGTAVMRVDGTEVVRGHETWVLRFDFRGRIGPVVAEDHTRSWLCPRSMSAFRYRKSERTPLGSRREEVEMFPSERRWEGAGGTRGSSPTDLPLDELSFLYFLRTLPLEDGSVDVLERHFDTGRNPVTVRVAGRTRLSVPAGDFATVGVTMQVKDPARGRGRGAVRIHFTDDARRTPVRIESSAPWLGTVVLSLQSRDSRPGTRSP